MPIIFFLLDLIPNVIALPIIVWQRFVLKNKHAGWYGIVMYSWANVDHAGGVKWSSSKAYWFRQSARLSTDEYTGAKGEDNNLHVEFSTKSFKA